MIMLTGSEDRQRRPTPASWRPPRPVRSRSHARGLVGPVLALKAALPATPVDTAGPVAHPPASRLSAGSTLGTTTVPSARHGRRPSCGIAMDALRRQQDGGGLEGRVARDLGHEVTSNRSRPAPCTVRRRGDDDAGNTGAWSNGRNLEPLIRQQAGGVVSFSAGWRTALRRYSGGTPAYARPRARVPPTGSPAARSHGSPPSVQRAGPRRSGWTASGARR